MSLVRGNSDILGLDFGSISGVMVQKAFLHRFDLQSDTHSPEYIAGIKGTSSKGRANRQEQ